MSAPRATLMFAVLAAATSTRAQAPHKVFVLPLDGNADAAVRAKLAGDIRDLATAEGNEVSTGDATFGETASAVGCQPDKPACVDKVIATLGVDEVVWGTATTTNGTTQVVVRRQTKGTPSRMASATIQPNEPPDAIKPTVGPLFGQAQQQQQPPPPQQQPSQPSTADRKIAITFLAGAGASLLVGFVLWGNVRSIQGQIDSAPTTTIADIQALKTLEDRAAGYALAGNVLFVVGLAAGGAGAYFLWRDHKHRTTIVPAPSEHGASVILRGTW